MALSGKRLTIPSSLALALIVTGCGPQPAPGNDSATADTIPPLSDACTMTNCVIGPISLCAPDDAGVLSCQSGQCTAAYTLDGGYLGQQCYGECVTSTLADGASQTGFC